VIHTLVIQVRRKTQNGTEGYEGVIDMPGLANAKLARKDGSTFFANRATMNTAARNLAKRLDLETKFTEPASAVRKAAKPASTRKNSQPASMISTNASA